MQRGGQVSRDHDHARRTVARHPALAWLVRGQGLRPTALRVGRAQAFAPGQQLLRVLRALYPLVVPGLVAAVGHRHRSEPSGVGPAWSGTVTFGWTTTHQ